MSAIGTKIEIKKPQKTKTNTISNTFNEIIDILKSKKIRDATKLEWCGYLFNVLDKYFEEDKEESIKKCKNVAIPTLYKIIESCNVEYMSQYYDFYFQLYKFCARYDFECFVDYYEWNSAKKVYAKRREILKPYVDALNRIAHDDKLEYLVVSFPPSAGKCVESNTPIWTPLGNKPIKNIKVGDEVYSMKNNEICIEKVTNKWETKKKQYKIKMKSGKEIIISPEHRMLTFDGYKMAKELKVGDYFYSYLKEREESIPIDENELVFISGMIFEGHCKEKHTSYTGELNEMTTTFLKSCDNLGIKYTKTTKKDCKASSYLLLQGKDKKNIELLKKYGILNHLCYTKRLPDCFFTMPLEQKYKFLGIMLATDGYIVKNNAGITLANEKLIDDIQFLLNMCGIYSRKRIKRYKQFTSWELIIPKEYMLSIKNKCYCYHKNDKLLSLKENKVLKRGNLSVKYPKQLFQNLQPTGKRNGYVEKLHIERNIDRTLLSFENFVKEYPQLEKYRYKDFYWEEIVDIEYIDKEIDMIDIEVSNTHNFIANGYVSHNSYLATLFSSWAYGLNINNSILRLSYSEELVLGFSRTVKGIISSPEFSEVFSNFKLYNGKPFEVEKESDWKIRNANVPKSNHIARTRGGATTGERASFAIIFDDMTKGAEEANNDSVHKGIYDKWQTEWMNRRDGLHCKFIFIGTQWSPEDILNRIIKDREKVSPLRETNNKFVMETEDKSTIVIRVPLLDEEGKTTCSEVYPQILAEQIRDNTDEFLFSCVYQQNPIPPVGRELSWNSIRTYKEIPSEMPKNSLATLDTARKGKDYIAMPIFKSDENGSYYLTDAICIKKPMEDLYEEIINKIESNVITTLVVENNIDVSLKMVLSMKLQERNITYCNIIEKYNSANKQQRIKDYRGIVQKQVIFPDKTIVKPNSDIGRLMENITKYSFELPNRNDDGIDAVCMFASEVIIGKSTFPKAKACRRPF